MRNSDEILLNGIWEKLKSGEALSKEDWQRWWQAFFSFKWSISNCSPEEFAGLQAQLQNGIRKMFLGGGQ